MPDLSKPSLPLFTRESFIFHLLVSCLGVAVLSFILDITVDRWYYDRFPSRSVIAAAIILGFACNARQRSLSAVFVWIPPLLALAYTAIDLTLIWNSSLDLQPRSAYILNQLFGPNCGDSECLYTIPAHAVSGTLTYAIAAYIRYKLNFLF